MIERLSQLEMTPLNRALRSNIRNAYCAESVHAVRIEAVSRAAQNKWFEAAVLFELACEIASEN